LNVFAGFLQELAYMARSGDKQANRLVQDGRGFRTPLQACGDDALAFLRRDIAALPKRPVHAAPKRKIHEPRPAPPQHPARSIGITVLQLLLAAVIVGYFVFSGLAWAGHIVSPDLPPMANGIAPYGPRVLLTFALYAASGLAAGCGTAYWMLRANQN
jgi:hypothetical protein